ncbi:MAG: peptide chain release factor N(5)-glutamine methyltransferase [Oscillospiraceae bacterium]
MNIKEYYEYGRRELPDPTECVLLTEKFFGKTRKDIAVNPEWTPENGAEFLAAVQRRKQGTPLQYILGYWFFCGMELSLTPGVLVPREDTMALVETAAAFIRKQKYRGLDLCAGTGAVALGLASLCENATVTAVELFPKPLACLRQNCARYGKGRVSVQEDDVLYPHGTYANLDFIVSNPPYIPAEEIASLQKEVQQEPREALDGGGDGLDFYRVIASRWAKCLRPGGMLAVEIGDTQAPVVTALLENTGIMDIRLVKDMNGKPRTLWGKRK